jgi:hypothetical protein
MPQKRRPNPREERTHPDCRCRGGRSGHSARRACEGQRGRWRLRRVGQRGKAPEQIEGRSRRWRRGSWGNNSPKLRRRHHRRRLLLVRRVRDASGTATQCTRRNDSPAYSVPRSRPTDRRHPPPLGRHCLRRGVVLAAAVASIFLGKDRRYLGKSQSKSPPKRTQNISGQEQALLR